jgi:hypothetical protein
VWEKLKEKKEKDAIGTSAAVGSLHVHRLMGIKLPVCKWCLEI